MEDLLIEVLSSFGFPVILQGSLAADARYPDNFFTFWNNFSDGDSFYDNSENSTVYDYDVNFYSNNPQLTYDILREAITLLKSQNFIVSGDGYSVASDEKTHTGRGINVKYLRRI